MTEHMHGHAMIQRTMIFRDNQHTCSERKLGKAIAHFTVHKIFLSKAHSETFRTFLSIPSIQSWLLSFLNVGRKRKKLRDGYVIVYVHWACLL
jgi:hypothetical protein